MPVIKCCPRCKSRDIVDHEDYITCLKCNLDFFKEFLGEINDENILAKQELEGFMDAFKDELKEKKKRKKFLKSLEKDNH